MTVPWVSFWKKACPELSGHLHWTDNQGFRRQHHQGTSWALEFRSQDSKLKSIWETVLKRCFSLFGLCLNDPRLRGLGSQDHRPEAWILGTLWRLIPIPKSLAAKIVTRGKIIGTSSPYLDELMMTNVRQIQIPRFPNDKRFQTKLWNWVHNCCTKFCNMFQGCGLLRKRPTDHTP